MVNDLPIPRAVRLTIRVRGLHDLSILTVIQQTETNPAEFLIENYGNPPGFVPRRVINEKAWPRNLY
jgi:hypothetical protein